MSKPHIRLHFTGRGWYAVIYRSRLSKRPYSSTGLSASAGRALGIAEIQIRHLIY